MILAVILLLTYLFKLIISTAYSLKDSEKFFMQSLLPYTSCLFSMILNDDIIDIENHLAKCSHNFVVDAFSGLFLHPSIFAIKESGSA